MLFPVLTHHQLDQDASSAFDKKSKRIITTPILRDHREIHIRGPYSCISTFFCPKNMGLPLTPLIIAHLSISTKARIDTNNHGKL